MRKNFGVLVASFFAMTVVSGCDTGKEAQSGGSGSSGEVKSEASYDQRMRDLINFHFDQTSPEGLVKSFWSFSDKQQEVGCYDAAAFKGATDLNKSLAKLYSGVPLEFKTRAGGYTREKCISDLQITERTIIKSEKQSDTRTVVYFNSKNITPIPAGASADEYDKKWREEGVDYKVDLVKEGDVWVIDQVYEKRFNDTWGQKYSKKDLLPSYPATVYEQFP